MKKIFIFAMMASAFAGAVNAQGIEWTTTAEQTVKSFVKAPKADERQIISNQAGMLVEGVNLKLNSFQVECLTTTQDLDGLPKFAEVNKLMLNGTNLEANRTMGIEAYAENTNETILRNIDLSLSEMPLPVEDFRVANMTEMTMPEQGQDGYIVELPFDVKPFYYLGEGAYITLNMSTPEDVKFNFEVTEAELEVPAVYRNSFFPYYAGMSTENAKVPEAYQTAFEAIVEALDLQPNTLPAYQLDYYTHDVFGTVVREGKAISGAQIVISQNGEDFTATSDENGEFVIEGLDYTKNCTINVVYGENDQDEQYEAVMNFGSQSNDILVNVTLSPSTAVESVNASKSVVAVNYLDMSGRMSNVPFNGVNVVVTRYADGTTNVSKVVR